jgi:hypothetical protein
MKQRHRSPNRCNFCGQSFRSNADLERHIDTKHNHVECSVYLDFRGSEQEVDSHVKRCYEKNKSQFSQQKKGHGSDRYKCPVCDERGPIAQGMRRHMQTCAPAQVEDRSHEVCRRGSRTRGEACRFSHGGQPSAKAAKLVGLAAA